MGWGKMVELLDSSRTAVYKGQGRTIAWLIISVLLLGYYLEIETSKSASPNHVNHVFLPTLSFATLHLFGILIFRQLRFTFTTFFQSRLWNALSDTFRICAISYANYGVIVLGRHRQSVNGRLVLFVLAYATFHYLLVINETGGENFRLGKALLVAALFLAMFLEQWQTFGAIVLIVSATLMSFEIYHVPDKVERLDRSATATKKKVPEKVEMLTPKPNAVDSVLKQQPTT